MCAQTAECAIPRLLRIEPTDLRPERNELKRDPAHVLGRTYLHITFEVDLEVIPHMTVIDRQPPVSEPPDPPRRKDRTHWLYIAVIAAVLVGIAVGILAPDVGKSVGVLGTMFVALIKMMIAPVIFCTIVLGIGSVRKAATVGKVGGLAFVYFLVMSTFALAIGLLVGNIIHPGSGMHLSDTAAGKGAELAEKAHESGGLMDFVQGIIPDTLFSSLTAGSVLQALFVALLVGFALQAMGSAGSRSCVASSICRSWCSRSW